VRGEYKVQREDGRWKREEVRGERRENYSTILLLNYFTEN